MPKRPPREYRQKRKRNKALGAVAAITLIYALLAAFIYINGIYRFFPEIPGWRDIYQALGVRGLSAASEAPVPKGGVTVHFIDVGQGDCALIQTETKNILIDGGERTEAGRVISYLAGANVKRLDCVVATHPHSDHIGSLPEVIGTYGADTVIMPRVPDDLVPATASYERLMDTVAAKGCELVYAEAGGKIDAGGSCTLDILAPIGFYDDLNDYSVVLKLTCGTKSFLFTGDIEEEAEQDLMDKGIDLSADIVKVPHHGSSTSSSSMFVLNVMARYAVISCGADNDFGHPDNYVVYRYESFEAKILRTDLNGSIVFTTDGSGLTVKTER